LADIYQQAKNVDMNTRRKFLVNGSMTAAAILATNPFKAIAGTGTLWNGTAASQFLVVMHTATSTNSLPPSTSSFISAIQRKTNNALLVKNETSNENGFDIVTKGGIKTGIIYLNANNLLSASALSNLAAQLKNEQQCKVVVCVSSIGYTHKTNSCDKQLAQESAGIDIFVGTNADNYTKNPMVLHNSLQHEVLLQSSFADDTAFGKVEIGFDTNGHKNHIHILNSVPKRNQQQQQNAIVAA
jgi:hypothetical protein